MRFVVLLIIYSLQAAYANGFDNEGVSPCYVTMNYLTNKKNYIRQSEYGNSCCAFSLYFNFIQGIKWIKPFDNTVPYQIVKHGFQIVLLMDCNAYIPKKDYKVCHECFNFAGRLKSLRIETEGCIRFHNTEMMLPGIKNKVSLMILAKGGEYYAMAVKKEGERVFLIVRGINNYNLVCLEKDKQSNYIYNESMKNFNKNNRVFNEKCIELIPIGKLIYESKKGKSPLVEEGLLENISFESESKERYGSTYSLYKTVVAPPLEVLERSVIYNYAKNRMRTLNVQNKGTDQEIDEGESVISELNSLRLELKEDVENDIKDDSEADIKVDFEEESEAESEEDIGTNIKENIGTNIKENIKDDIKENIKENIKDDIEADIGTNIKADGKENIESDEEFDSVFYNSITIRIPENPKFSQPSTSKSVQFIINEQKNAQSESVNFPLMQAHPKEVQSVKSSDESSTSSSDSGNLSNSNPTYCKTDPRSITLSDFQQNI